ncbi:hypothetical protein J6590_086698 [Homalodisca vitripennis]|nr:hypothetical protein J6590_086698 [Homalodisca vitripennis]
MAQEHEEAGGNDSEKHVEHRPNARSSPDQRCMATKLPSREDKNSGDLHFSPSHHAAGLVYKSPVSLAHPERLNFGSDIETCCLLSRWTGRHTTVGSNRYWEVQATKVIVACTNLSLNHKEFYLVLLLPQGSDGDVLNPVCTVQNPFCLLISLARRLRVKLGAVLLHNVLGQEVSAMICATRTVYHVLNSNFLSLALASFEGISARITWTVSVALQRREEVTSFAAEHCSAPQISVKLQKFNLDNSASRARVSASSAVRTRSLVLLPTRSVREHEEVRGILYKAVSHPHPELSSLLRLYSKPSFLPDHHVEH